MSLSVLLGEFPELVAYIVGLIKSGPEEYHPSLYILQCVSRKFRNLLRIHCRGRNKYNIVDYAIRSGSMSLLEWTVSQKFYVSARDVENTTRFGHIDMFKYLFDPGKYHSQILISSNSLLSIAASYGDIQKYKQVEKIIMQHGYNSLFGSDVREIITGAACNSAAQCGHFKMLKWFINAKKYSYNQFTYQRAASSKNPEIVKWMVEKLKPKHNHSSDVCFAAIKAGHIDLLKWLIDNKFSCDCGVLGYIAFTGNLELLKNFQEQLHQQDRNYIVSNEAVRNGHIHILEWLDSNGLFIRSDDIFARAASCGQRHVVEWLGAVLDISSRGTAIKLGCKFDCCGGEVSYDANHIIDNIKWLMSMGMSMDGEIFLDVVRIINKCNTKSWPEVLEWLIENKCKWDDRASYQALVLKNTKVFRWLLAHGCPYRKTLSTSLFNKGNLKLIKWCVRNGYVKIEDFDKKVIRGVTSCYNIRRWLQMFGRDF